MSKMNQVREVETDLVSFRLDREFRKLLEDRAAAHGQPRPNLFARILLQRALTDTADAELRSAVEALRGELRRVREDIATAVFVLLVKSAKEDPEKAKAWVREHLSK